MNADKFKEIYNLPRNGTDGFIRHPLSRKLTYSEGVAELAEEGIHWLLDIIATEIPQVMQGVDAMGIFKVVVVNSKAKLKLELQDDAPPAWSREIEYTDMPDGTYMFYINDDERDGMRYSMILPNEY